MRRVRDPHGAAWTVDVAWTDIEFWSKFRRKREERAQPEWERSSSRSQPNEEKDRGWWLNGLDAVPDAEFFLAGIVVALLVIVLVFAFPWLLVLFIDVVELLAFPLLAAGIIGWRVMRKRPFTITAMCANDIEAQWTVVGVREARRVERAVADAVVAGGEPKALFPDYVARR